MRERKPVTRTQSAPHRRPGQAKHTLKRQISSEVLPTADNEQEMETNQPLISLPNTVSEKGNCEPSSAILATELRRSRAHAIAINTVINTF